jgi:hypothetical protein
MKILIACEFSGVVRRAFRGLGHDAWSCDLLPAEDDSPHHHQCDYRDIINQSWDFVGYHNDCRVMANSGVRWLYDAAKKETRWRELTIAADMFNQSLRDPRPGYVENSIMHCHAKALLDREQDQTIQPWWFGVPRFKATCLWLRGSIAPLTATNKLTPPAKGTPEHKTWSAVHRASPGPNRWKERSRTFEGVARAMAEQWGGSATPPLTPHQEQP